jgi:hypothetical protein
MTMPASPTKNDASSGTGARALAQSIAKVFLGVRTLRGMSAEIAAARQASHAAAGFPMYEPRAED